MDLEICADNYETVLYASKLRFKRVELCSALELGGLSPNIGLIEKCCQIPNIETHIILRPRTGNFHYSPEEMEEMRIDLERSIDLGISGIVIGVLNAKNEVDLEKNSYLLNIAKQAGLEVSFHRAVDFTPSLNKSLLQIIKLGFDRILSSGQEKTAYEGKNTLSEMVKFASNKIEIMAGSGISPENAKMISETGVDALHFTARRAKNKPDPFQMGLEFEIDKTKIQGILAAL